MKIKIEKMGINGEGIGKLDHKIVFVKGALKDEIVDVRIIEEHKNYKIAELNKIIKRSKERVDVSCPYYEKCGACQIMQMNYEAQLAYKKAHLLETLNKYFSVDPKIVSDVIRNDEPLYYRNSLKLPVKMVDGKLISGLYQSDSNRFLPVKDCLIHAKNLEKVKKNVLNVLNKYHVPAYERKSKKGLRAIFLRELSDKYQLALISGKDNIDKTLIDDLLKIEGLEVIDQYIKTNDKHDFFSNELIHHTKKHYLTFTFDGLKLNISPRSFFQLNTKQALKLYQTVAMMIPHGLDLIFEAYAGIGTISLMLKDHAKEIVGVEEIASAVNNANLNAKRNKIANVSFICDDAAHALKMYSKKRKIDLLIVDPPRSGLSDEMLINILRSKIKYLVYVSCNPATLAKNLAVLNDNYQVIKIVPLDMFSETSAVESITLLIRR